MPACAACGNDKPRSDFSKAQFKKPADSRNCKACCGTTVQVTVRCYHCKKVQQDDGEKFFQCRGCRSVSYCGEKCAKADWKAGHKELCGKLNRGDAEQLGHREGKGFLELTQSMRADLLNGVSGTAESNKFFELFLKSAEQDDDKLERTAESMKKWFRRQSRLNKKIFSFQSVMLLTGCPTSMLKLPTSPLTIALACHVDPSAMSTPSNGVSDGNGSTMLHWLAEAVDGSKKSSFKNQVILGQQLIDAGANVNARAERGIDHSTVLHRACHSSVTTNVKFIKLLLENGADVNSQNHLGETPLMHAIPYATGAAKVLVQCDGIDLNIKTRDGRIALAMLRASIGDIERYAGRNEEEQRSFLFTASQLKELEEMMVAGGAHDDGIAVGYDSGFFPLRGSLG